MEITDSILQTVKINMGDNPDSTDFDADMIRGINSAFFNLWQMGIGPTSGFRIEDDSAVWTDFLDEGPILDAVIEYVYLFTQRIVDPGLTSTVNSAKDAIISELEWRLTNAHSCV